MRRRNLFILFLFIGILFSCEKQEVVGTTNYMGNVPKKNEELLLGRQL